MEPTAIKVTPLSLWNHYLAKNLLRGPQWWKSPGVQSVVDAAAIPIIPLEPLSSHQGCVVCHIVMDDDGTKVEPKWPFFFSFASSVHPPCCNNQQHWLSHLWKGSPSEGHLWHPRSSGHNSVHNINCFELLSWRWVSALRCHGSHLPFWYNISHPNFAASDDLVQ